VGLGLFVTQQIVHRYGGSIRVESAPGEGTLFVLELPAEASRTPVPAFSSLEKLNMEKINQPLSLNQEEGGGIL
jgi:hypothetical protein